MVVNRADVVTAVIYTSQLIGSRLLHHPLRMIGHQCLVSQPIRDSTARLSADNSSTSNQLRTSCLFVCLYKLTAHTPSCLAFCFKSLIINCCTFPPEYPSPFCLPDHVSYYLQQYIIYISVSYIQMVC